ncbi:uncharacterized protein LOC143452571 [Clavelina lepadiformis]|uniref:uncharacterized protein LOC143452571 n=1 Tax=Clavelina lepadiformis TaxID=159417 RepID=UPI004041FA05
MLREMHAFLLKIFLVFPAQTCQLTTEASVKDGPPSHNLTSFDFNLTMLVNDDRVNCCTLEPLSEGSGSLEGSNLEILNTTDSTESFGYANLNFSLCKQCLKTSNDVSSVEGIIWTSFVFGVYPVIVFIGIMICVCGNCERKKERASLTTSA